MNRKLEPEHRHEQRFRIAVVTTGGTIAKTYDPERAALRNCRQVVAEIVQSLRLEGAEVSYIDLMHKDSLEIDDDDRELIVSTVEEAARGNDAVVVTHGTDTLRATADALWANDPHPSVPVIRSAVAHAARSRTRSRPDTRGVWDDQSTLPRTKSWSGWSAARGMISSKAF